jgi:hypothetical protein
VEALMDVRDESSLERDLCSNSRDGLYRALSYLESRGAPVVSAPAEIARMRNEAATGLEWLDRRDDRERIATEYEPVLENWSPLFED